MSCHLTPNRPLIAPCNLGRVAMRSLLKAALCLSSLAVIAAPTTVLPFGKQTWRSLTAARGQPSAIVFSTTDCSHCPAVIENLSSEVHKRQTMTKLIVVVIDGASQYDALLHEPHFRPADVLYAFDDDSDVLRYTVNPDWRGLTPYIALIRADGKVSFHTGAPPAEVVRRFLGR
jgi:hypothetical protein